MFVRSALIAIAILSPFAALASTGPPSRGDRELVRAALAASGVVDPIDLTLDQRAVEHEIERIVQRMGSGRPSYRRARRLHALLHRRYLSDYHAEADDLGGVLRDGRFNCVSGTLLYGLVARRLGFEVELLEYPGHLFVRLHLPTGRAIDVETTSRHGFDTADHQSGGPTILGDGERLPTTARASAVYRRFPLDATVGFAWLNHAWRSLDDGNPLRAAESALQATRFLPHVRQDDDLRRLLTRAFRSVYERGAFELAYEVAAIDVSLFPLATTSRDRLIAAAIKRLEFACDRDAPAVAESMLIEVERRLGPAEDVERFTRRTAPIVAEAAVRLGEWSVARRAASRYAQVEPDDVEARRVIAWVEAREAAAEESPAGACPQPTEESSRISNHHDR